MKRYSYFIIIIVVVAVIAFYPSQKKRINKVIEGCRQAIIHEDLDGLMQHISFNYTDAYGGSYLQFKKRAEMSFRSYDDFEIELDRIKIDVKEKNATVGLNVSIIASAGNERGYLIGDAAGFEKTAVYLEKTSYNWKVIKIQRLTRHEGVGILQSNQKTLEKSL